MKPVVLTLAVAGIIIAALFNPPYSVQPAVSGSMRGTITAIRYNRWTGRTQVLVNSVQWEEVYN
jgi:hypothetical protein